ncbi:MAG: hypothetical protein RL033_7693 [Pseudomonadota bacterium]
MLSSVCVSRRHRRPGGALPWVLTCGLLAVPAHAQSAPVRERLSSETEDSGDAPEVEGLVASAISLRAEGKDREALATLRQASRIDPRSLRVLVHLANVYQALGEWLLADEFLRQALAVPQHPYVQRHRQALAEARSVIDEHLGKLEVAGEPVGAEVSLNGQKIGTLPLAAPVPVLVGAYTLEVRMPGHYTVSRPLTISARDHVRESIRLEQRPPEERSAPVLGATRSQLAPSVPLERPAERPWLTWTLGGLSVAAAATTLGAVLYREAHARRWNDPSRCLSTDRTRAQLCGSERDKVEAGAAWAISAGVATGVFAAGALLNAYVFVDNPAGERAGLEGCELGLRGASCFGSF